MLEWHRELIALRKSLPALQNLNKNYVRANIVYPCVWSVNRLAGGSGNDVLCVFNFSDSAVAYTLPGGADSYRVMLDSHTEPKDMDITRESVIRAGESIQLSAWNVLVLEVAKSS